MADRCRIQSSCINALRNAREKAENTRLGEFRRRALLQSPGEILNPLRLHDGVVSCFGSILLQK